MNARESEKPMSDEMNSEPTPEVLLSLAAVIDATDSPILPGLTPTPHDIARAVIAAGWVSPEEHATYRNLATTAAENDLKRIGEAEASLLVLRAQVAKQGPIIQRVEALAAEWISWANGGTDRSWSRAADYGEEFGRELRERIANGDDEPPALEAS